MSTLTESVGNEKETEDRERALALLKHLGREALDFELENDAVGRFTLLHGGDEYIVVTDEEADELWEKDLENFLDSCILTEIPEQYHKYFDNDAWISDAKDGERAESLNRYDGTENIYEVNGTDYYVYRQN